jgi:hypothetical protein
MRTPSELPSATARTVPPRAAIEPDAEVAPIFDSGRADADPFGSSGNIADDGPPKEEEIDGLFVDLIEEER